MIVNSDERQWSWMDEGLNMLYAIYGRTRNGNKLPSRGPASKIVPYMSGDQNSRTNHVKFRNNSSIWS
jgi:hypothetical protein